MNSPAPIFWNTYGRSFIFALVTLYLPHIWVFWIGLKYPSENHNLWMAMFPTMPGNFVAAVIRNVYYSFTQQHLSDLILLLVAAIFTLILIAILTAIGARGKPWQVAAVILGGGYSVVAAMALYAASRV